MIMIEIVTNQLEINSAYFSWVKQLVEASSFRGRFWWINNTSISFNNYGHGETGQIKNQVVFGLRSDPSNNIVKISLTNWARGEDGPHTIIGRDAKGSLIILRAGRLNSNNISDAITDEFEKRTQLVPVELTLNGRHSKKKWFKVADLSGTADEIIVQTVAFVTSCATARYNNFGSAESRLVETFSLGLSEKGKTYIANYVVGSREVQALHGFVWEALKNNLGDRLEKIGANGFELDGIVRNANLLIEIKTGITPYDLYTAVGQLALYPHLIGLPTDMIPILLVPDLAEVSETMKHALKQSGVELFTYSVDFKGTKPKITFSASFLQRCRVDTVTRQGS
jgi:hypothetical protein